nr:hypothetical protein [uncultured Prevotella sp.]
MSLNTEEEKFLGKWAFDYGEIVSLDSTDDGNLYVHIAGTTIYKADKTTSFEGSIKYTYKIRVDDGSLNYVCLCNYSSSGSWRAEGDSLISKVSKQNFELKDIKLYGILDEAGERIDLTNDSNYQESIEEIKRRFRTGIDDGNGEDKSKILSITDDRITMCVSDNGDKLILKRIE